MPPVTLLLIGSGPGIGVHVASHFATKHAFSTIALIARTRARLQQNREAVVAAAQKSGQEVDVRTFAVDITATKEFEKVLQEVKGLGELGCVVFNAARVGGSTFFEAEEQLMLEDFMTTNIALYATARWAMPLLRASPSAHKSLLVTSSLLWQEPILEMFALSMVKASQRTLVLSLQRSFPDVHVALLSVPVQVGTGEGMVSAEKVAERMWELYAQGKEGWLGELGV